MFYKALHDIPAEAGVRPIRLPPRSPIPNAYLEPFRRTLKKESLTRELAFGEDALRRILPQFVAHYHGEP